MTQQEIQQRNREIALMLGWDNDKQILFYPPHQYGSMKELSELKFHSDWNWLMEAVEFIEQLEYSTTCHFHPTTNLQGFSIYDKRGELIKMREEIRIPKKEAVFIAVSDFAKSYNEVKL